MRPEYAHALFIVVAAACGFASVITQRRLIPLLITPKGVITSTGWDAFKYLKTSTPGSAIVLSSSPWDRVMYVVSGLGARAGYSDGGPMTNTLDIQARKLNPSEDRYARMEAMGAARNPAELCSLLTSTPVTHILEESSNRLMPNLPCLTRLWTGPDGATAVWKVVRSVSHTQP